MGMVPAATEDAVEQHHGEHRSFHHPQHGQAFQKRIGIGEYTLTVYHIVIIDSIGSLESPP